MADNTTTQDERQAAELEAFTNPEEILSQPEQEAAPNMVEMTVAGRTFEVTPEQKEALDLQDALHQQQISDMSSVPAEAPSEELSADEDWKDGFYADPDATLEKFKAELLDTVRQTVSDENQRTSQQDDFWSEFYRENSDLSNDKDIVNMVLSTNPDIQALPVSNASKALATKTKEKILSIAKAYGATQETVGDLHLTGGDTEVTREEPAEADDNIPVSLSAAIAERRRTRSKSA
jgi:hypothetical protein